MAIPFKSPISIDTIVPSSMEPTTKLTLGAYSIKLQSGTNTSIAINGSSTGSLALTSSNVNLTSSNLSVYDSYSNLLLNCNSVQNTFGNDNSVTMIKGNNLYLYRKNEPIIEAWNNQIVIGDSVNRENYDIKLYGKSLTIDSPNINITKKDGGSFIIPPYTQLSSIVEDRRLQLKSLACIQDINNSIINKVAFSHVWKENQPIIFVMPGAKGVTKLEDSDGREVYTFGTGVRALIGIRTRYLSGSNYMYSCTFIEIKRTEFNFIHKDTGAVSPWTWTNSNNSNFVYISNYSLL